MGDSTLARQCFLVEWYQPDLAASALDDAVDRLECAVGAAQVRLLVVLTAPVDETVFAVFAADSAEAVVAACHQAGWRTDRVTAGVQARITAPDC